MPRYGSVHTIDAVQMKELVTKIGQAVPSNLPDFRATHCLARSNVSVVQQKVRRILWGNDREPWALWEDFYREVFDVALNLSRVPVPPHQDGFDWLAYAFVRSGVHDEAIISLLAGHCIGKVIPRVRGFWTGVSSVRQTVKPYAFWVQLSREADMDCPGLRLKDFLRIHGDGITFEEHILLHMFYSWLYRGHLDVSGTTICAGSLCENEIAPTVRWDKDELVIDIILRDFAPLATQRYRRVIVLPDAGRAA